MYAEPVTIAILSGWINRKRMEALSNEYHLEQGGLLRVFIASLVASTIALTVFILPAEFDSDPTGLGEMMGGGRMGSGGEGGWEDPLSSSWPGSVSSSSQTAASIQLQ